MGFDAHTMEDLMGQLVKTEDRIRSYAANNDANDSNDANDANEERTQQQNYETCRDILNCLIDDIRRSQKGQFSETQLSLRSKLEKVIQSLMKTLRVQKRQRKRSAEFTGATTGSSDGVISEDALMELAQSVIKESTARIVVESDLATDTCAVVVESDTNGLPLSIGEYKHRLEKYSKELYKNPPVLPPKLVVVMEPNANHLPRVPQRDATTKRLTFFMPFEEQQSTKNVKSTGTNMVVADFHPNVTPEEVLLEGAFGGTYFRDIHSAVTNTQYVGANVIHETLAPEWLSKYDAKSISTKLTSQTYRTAVNKFKVKCGGSLGMWESSGWISNVDPYGWFQWYCRFYRGRRSSDDARQISRWKALAGSKGRFKSQLCNKILQKASTMTTVSTTSSKERKKVMIAAIHDISISPVVRQTLLHWGLTITEEVMDLHERSHKQ